MFGVGGEYRFYDNFSVRLDWTRYLFDEGIDIPHTYFTDGSIASEGVNVNTGDSDYFNINLLYRF